MALPFMLFESKAKDTVEKSAEGSVVSLRGYIDQILDRFKSASEIAKREVYAKRRKILFDDWKDLLKDRLEETLDSKIQLAVMGKYKTQVDIAMNPAQDIWNELGSVLYSTPPVRKYGDDEAQNEAYKNLLEETNFDLFMKEVDIAFEAFNNVFITPSITLINGEPTLKHRWYAGDNVMIVPQDDDPTEMEALILVDYRRNAAGKVINYFILWSDKWHCTFNDKGQIIKNPSGKNFLETIPFVEIKESNSSGGYWNTTMGDRLVELTLNIGAYRTQTNYLWKMSSHKQILGYGDGVTRLNQPEQFADPGAVLMFDMPQGSSMQVVDWQPNFEARRKWINDDYSNAIASKRINPKRMMREGNDGYDYGLAERARNKTGLFKTVEKKYARILAIVDDYYKIGKPTLKQDQKLEIEYQRYEFPQDPIKLLEYYQKAIDLNFDRITGAIQKLHPEWSEERVREFYEENVDENTKLAEMRAKRNSPTDITVESLSAQQFGLMGPKVREANKEEQSKVDSPATSSGISTDDKKE